MNILRNILSKFKNKKCIQFSQYCWNLNLMFYITQMYKRITYHKKGFFPKNVKMYVFLMGYMSQ